MQLKTTCLLLTLLVIAGCESDPAEVIQADTLYVGSHIITMDATAVNTVAVKGDTIIWVGQREAWTGHAATTIELGDSSLLPGFIDAHGHLSGVASYVSMANLSSPPVGPVETIDDLKAELGAYISRLAPQPGEWVVGQGYDDSLLAEKRHPDRDDLDAVSTDHPIALVHVSGHLGVVNSRALELMGMGPETEDPAGGVIRRRPGTSIPNGVLEETAAMQVRAYMPTESPDLNGALREYASHGVTTVQESAASLPFLEFLKQQAAHGEINLDVVAYPAGMDPTFELPNDIEKGKYIDGVKLGGVKLFLDGSPQGKTAYLSEPYEVVPAGQPDDYRGYPMIPQAAVDELVARYVAAGVPMHVHCNGDAAAQMLLDALERASAGGAALGDHRTVMIHAQTVREDQIDQMKTLGVIPSYFSAHTFYWGDWHRDSVLGVERASRISPTKSTLDREMPFTVHNDAPVVPPDMVRLLWATVNRETRSGQVLGADQRLNALEALKAITINAAYQHFDVATKGSITPGKQADLVILSANPLEMPADRLLELKVLETISRGVTVYKAEP